MLTVPKYFSANEVHETLLDKLGFRDVPGRNRLRKESDDEFIARQSGYIKFYAAIVEVMLCTYSSAPCDGRLVVG